MSYQAVVTRIKVAPHPNADKIQLGVVCGATVIVGLDVKDNDLGVFFEDGGQLSEAFCKEHDLVARKDADGNRAGGFFSEKRRVRVQAFRGIKSEGFWVPISHFKFTGFDLSKLKEGDMFSELNKVEICRKYYSDATLRRMAKEGRKLEREARKTKVMMPEHHDTAQFRFANLHKGDLVYITLKTHGTSVRYGLVDVIHGIPKWKAQINKFFNIFKRKQTLEYKIGTRRVILPKTKTGWSGGYYGDGQPYVLAETLLKDKLKPNEIVYGEILGYCPNGAALFTADTKGDKELLKKYGPKITYSYGCVEGQAKFQVYRITQNGVELPWNEVLIRCRQLGVEPVIELARVIYNGDMYNLNKYVDSFLEGEDPMDNRHPREGVCIRVESPVTGTKIWKAKSYTFKFLEGLVKDDDNNVDIEEIA